MINALNGDSDPPSIEAALLNGTAPNETTNITGVANRDIDRIFMNTGVVTHVDSGIVFANPDTG